MNAEWREQFAAAVREPQVDLGLAAALIATEADASQGPAAALDRLDGLAERVPTHGSDHQRLLAVLGIFRGEPHNYRELRASLLPEVLRRRSGLPILLSVVWLEVARRVEIPAFGTSLPGHYVVALGRPGEPSCPIAVVDPFHGGRPLAAQGPLEEWTTVPTLLRILTNIRAWARNPERVRTALWATELSLLLPGHPAELRAERGRLLARVGDYAHGAAELEAYAEVVEVVDEQQAVRLRREAGMARAQLN